MSTTADLSAPARLATTNPDQDVTRSPRSGAVIALLTRLHFYAGILIAPFLVVAALTGLAFVYTPQLDNIVYDHELHVARVVSGGAHPLSEQVAAARAAHPQGALATVLPPATADATTAVVFSLPELGEKRHTVYVDPYTNTVRGQLTTWYSESPITTWLDDLHRNLHLGTIGRMYSELAASWLWILTLGGLVLWLHRQRRVRRRIRRTLLPERAAAGVRRTRGLHAATGIWLAVGLLGLSATGLTWSGWAGGHFDTALTALHAHAPQIDTALPTPATSGHHHGGAVPAAAGADLAEVDTVVAGARAAGLTGPIEVSIPAGPGTAWLVAQTDRSWPVRFDKAAIDPTTGTVTARSDYDQWPLLARLSKLGVQAHMGYLFGLANQLLLTALALGLLAIVGFGYRMWWQRRPIRADYRAPVGAPPARGAWRRLPWPVLACGAGATAALGWALPEFGGTLAGFLIIDIIVGAVRRRRSAAYERCGG